MVFRHVPGRRRLLSLSGVRAGSPRGSGALQGDQIRLPDGHEIRTPQVSSVRGPSLECAKLLRTRFSLYDSSSLLAFRLGVPLSNSLRRSPLHYGRCLYKDEASRRSCKKIHNRYKNPPFYYVRRSIARGRMITAQEGERASSRAPTFFHCSTYCLETGDTLNVDFAYNVCYIDLTFISVISLL